MTFSVMNTIATRSRMGHLPLGRSLVAEALHKTSLGGISCISNVRSLEPRLRCQGKRMYCRCQAPFWGCEAQVTLSTPCMIAACGSQTNL